MIDLKFARVSEDVIVPSKLDEDGCYDVYAYFSEGYRKIKQHQTVCIPTGFHTSFSEDYVALLKERGSTGTKGIAQRSGVIDSGYRGEWMVPLTNTNNKLLIIAKKDALYEKDGMLYDGETHTAIVHIEDCIVYPYEKAIAQFRLAHVPKVTFTELTVDELKSIPSSRGEGKLGSSGK